MADIVRNAIKAEVSVGINMQRDRLKLSVPFIVYC